MKYLSGAVVGLAMFYWLWSPQVLERCEQHAAGFEQEKAGLYSTLAYQQGLVDRAERREAKAYAKVGELKAELKEFYQWYAVLAAREVDLSIPGKPMTKVNSEPSHRFQPWDGETFVMEPNITTGFGTSIQQVADEAKQSSAPWWKTLKADLLRVFQAPAGVRVK